MKNFKKITLVLILIVSLICLCSCDSNINIQGQAISGNRIIGGRDVQRFDYAYIILGDKLIAQGKIEQWRDYQSGDEIQIVIDGRYYLTHYSNVVMVAEATNTLGYSSYQDYSSK